MDDIHRIASTVIKKSSSDDFFSKGLMAQWKEDEQTFFVKSKELDHVMFSELNDEEFRNTFTDYVDTYLRAISCSFEYSCADL